MIRLTRIPAERSQQKDAPIVLIPGGPGLSSRTLAPLVALNRQRDLYFVDLPGANGVPFQDDVTFDGVCDEITAEMSALSGPVFLLGHSFGGFFAAEVALRVPSVSGLICLSVPFTKVTLANSAENYSKGMSVALKDAADAWSKSPNMSTFNRWMAACGPIYFSDGNGGAALLGTDLSSFEVYRALRKDADAMEPLLDRLAEWKGLKLFFAGEEDPLFLRSHLESEARRARAHFHALPGAKHFLHFDQPETVVRLIDDFLSTEGR